jgi:hypothetical protein
VTACAAAAAGSNVVSERTRIRVRTTPTNREARVDITPPPKHTPRTVAYHMNGQ